MDLNAIKSRLLELIKEKALFYQPIELTSGKKSKYYVDGKQITLSGEGAWLVAKAVLDLIKDDNIEAIGGPTIGADPILGAIVSLSHLSGSPIKGFIVRKESKKHGLQKYIEGPFLEKGMRVVIIDDVVTTGGSLLKAAKAAQELGCEVVKIIVLVDRLEGAIQKLEQHEFKLISLFTRDDLDISL